MEEIRKIADEIGEKIIAARRDFHRYPELAFREFRTASLIARRLTDLGVEFKVGREIMDAAVREDLPSETVLREEFERAERQGGDREFLERVRGGFPAVAAIIRNGAGPVIAFRADIDALPIEESAEERHPPFRQGFASINAGVSHACGHDAHAATALGLAEILTRVKDQFRGTVKIVFQPAEETLGGAAPIAQSGFLDDVDRLLMVHYFSPWGPGEITCVRGDGYLAISRFDAVFKGEAAHAGGLPEGGKNALLAAANAVINLNAIPRHSQGATRVNVGKLAAGDARNIICARARLEMETRGATSALNVYVREHAERILKASAELWDCGLELVPMGGASGGGSDADVADEIMAFAAKTNILKPRDEQRKCGSDDFMVMAERVRKHGGKAAAITVGAAPGGKHHGPDFDLNEKVMKNTAIFLSELILNMMNKARVL